MWFPRITSQSWFYFGSWKGLGENILNVDVSIPFWSMCAPLRCIHNGTTVHSMPPNSYLTITESQGQSLMLGLRKEKPQKHCTEIPWHQMRNISRLFLLIEGCLGTTVKIFCSSMFWLSSGWEISGGQTSWVLSFCKRMPDSQCYLILLT